MIKKGTRIKTTGKGKTAHLKEEQHGIIHRRDGNSVFVYLDNWDGLIELDIEEVEKDT